jgi:hypothetical protein
VLIDGNFLPNIKSLVDPLNMWLPFGGEVAWEIEVYWLGRIESWETQGESR